MLRFGRRNPLRGGVLEGGGGMPYLNTDSLEKTKPGVCPEVKSLRRKAKGKSEGVRDWRLEIGD